MNGVTVGIYFYVYFAVTLTINIIIAISLLVTFTKGKSYLIPHFLFLSIRDNLSS